MSPATRLSDLADLLGAELVGDGSREIRGVRPLDSAEKEHLSFLHNPKYVEDARSSRAGAILVADASSLPGRDLLVCAEPYLALAHALEHFHPRESPPPGVHPSAVVAEKYPGPGANCWYGHPARLTVEGETPDETG